MEKLDGPEMCACFTITANGDSVYLSLERR